MAATLGFSPPAGGGSHSADSIFGLGDSVVGNVKPAIGDFNVPACVSANENAVSSCVSAVADAIISAANANGSLHLTQVSFLPSGIVLLDLKIALQCGQTSMVAAMSTP